MSALLRFKRAGYSTSTAQTKDSSQGTGNDAMPLGIPQPQISRYIDVGYGQRAQNVRHWEGRRRKVARVTLMRYGALT
eukprot:9176358-Pyramimonas_sp.AAC.1